MNPGRLVRSVLEEKLEKEREHSAELERMLEQAAHYGRHLLSQKEELEHECQLLAQNESEEHHQSEGLQHRLKRAAEDHEAQFTDLELQNEDLRLRICELEEEARIDDRQRGQRSQQLATVRDAPGLSNFIEAANAAIGVLGRWGSLYRGIKKLVEEKSLRASLDDAWERNNRAELELEHAEVQCREGRREVSQLCGELASSHAEWSQGEVLVQNLEAWLHTEREETRSLREQAASYKEQLEDYTLSSFQGDRRASAPAFRYSFMSGTGDDELAWRSIRSSMSDNNTQRRNRIYGAAEVLRQNLSLQRLHMRLREEQAVSLKIQLEEEASEADAAVSDHKEAQANEEMLCEELGCELGRARKEERRAVAAAETLRAKLQESLGCCTARQEEVINAAAQTLYCHELLAGEHKEQQEEGAEARTEQAAHRSLLERHEEEVASLSQEVSSKHMLCEELGRELGRKGAEETKAFADAEALQAKLQHCVGCCTTSQEEVIKAATETLHSHELLAAEHTELQRAGGEAMARQAEHSSELEHQEQRIVALSQEEALRTTLCEELGCELGRTKAEERQALAETEALKFKLEECLGSLTRGQEEAVAAAAETLRCHELLACEHRDLQEQTADTQADHRLMLASQEQRHAELSQEEATTHFLCQELGQELGCIRLEKRQALVDAETLRTKLQQTLGCCAATQEEILEAVTGTLHSNELFAGEERELRRQGAEARAGQALHQSLLESQQSAIANLSQEEADKNFLCEELGHELGRLKTEERQALADAGVLRTAFQQHLVTSTGRQEEVVEAAAQSLRSHELVAGEHSHLLRQLAELETGVALQRSMLQTHEQQIADLCKEEARKHILCEELGHELGRVKTEERQALADAIVLRTAFQQHLATSTGRQEEVVEAAAQTLRSHELLAGEHSHLQRQSAEAEAGQVLQRSMLEIHEQRIADLCKEEALGMTLCEELSRELGRRTTEERQAAAETEALKSMMEAWLWSLARGQEEAVEATAETLRCHELLASEHRALTGHAADAEDGILASQEQRIAALSQEETSKHFLCQELGQELGRLRLEECQALADAEALRTTLQQSLGCCSARQEELIEAVSGTLYSHELLAREHRWLQTQEEEARARQALHQALLDSQERVVVNLSQDEANRHVLCEELSCELGRTRSHERQALVDAEVLRASLMQSLESFASTQEEVMEAAAETERSHEFLADEYRDLQRRMAAAEAGSGHTSQSPPLGTQEPGDGDLSLLREAVGQHTLSEELSVELGRTKFEERQALAEAEVLRAQLQHSLQHCLGSCASTQEAITQAASEALLCHELLAGKHGEVQAQAAAAQTAKRSMLVAQEREKEELTQELDCVRAVCAELGSKLGSAALAERRSCVDSENLRECIQDRAENYSNLHEEIVQTATEALQAHEMMVAECKALQTQMVLSSSSSSQGSEAARIWEEALRESAGHHEESGALRVLCEELANELGRSRAEESQALVSFRGLQEALSRSVLLQESRDEEIVSAASSAIRCLTTTDGLTSSQQQPLEAGLGASELSQETRKPSLLASCVESLEDREVQRGEDWMPSKTTAAADSAEVLRKLAEECQVLRAACQEEASKAEKHVEGRNHAQEEASRWQWESTQLRESKGREENLLSEAQPWQEEAELSRHSCEELSRQLADAHLQRQELCDQLSQLEGEKRVVSEALLSESKAFKAKLAAAAPSHEGRAAEQEELQVLQRECALLREEAQRNQVQCQDMEKRSNTEEWQGRSGDLELELELAVNSTDTLRKLAGECELLQTICQEEAHKAEKHLAETNHARQEASQWEWESNQLKEAQEENHFRGTEPWREEAELSRQGCERLGQQLAEAHTQRQELRDRLSELEVQWQSTVEVLLAESEGLKEEAGAAAASQQQLLLERCIEAGDLSHAAEETAVLQQECALLREEMWKNEAFSFSEQPWQEDIPGDPSPERTATADPDKDMLRKLAGEVEVLQAAYQEETRKAAKHLEDRNWAEEEAHRWQSENNRLEQEHHGEEPFRIMGPWKEEAELRQELAEAHLHWQELRDRLGEFEVQKHLAIQAVMTEAKGSEAEELEKLLRSEGRAKKSSRSDVQPLFGAEPQQEDQLADSKTFRELADECKLLTQKANRHLEERNQAQEEVSRWQWENARLKEDHENILQGTKPWKEEAESSRQNCEQLGQQLAEEHLHTQELRDRLGELELQRHSATGRFLTEGKAQQQSLLEEVGRSRADLSRAVEQSGVLQQECARLHEESQRAEAQRQEDELSQENNLSRRLAEAHLHEQALEENIGALEMQGQTTKQALLAQCEEWHAEALGTEAKMASEKQQLEDEMQRSQGRIRQAVEQTNAMERECVSLQEETHGNEAQEQEIRRLEFRQEELDLQLVETKLQMRSQLEQDTQAQLTGYEAQWEAVMEAVLAKCEGLRAELQHTSDEEASQRQVLEAEVEQCRNHREEEELWMAELAHVGGQRDSDNFQKTLYEEAERSNARLQEVELLQNLSKELGCQLGTTRRQELQALASLEALRTGVQSLSEEQVLGEREVVSAVQAAISLHESLASECEDLRRQAASGPSAAAGNQVALEQCQELAETRLHEIQSLNEQASQWPQMKATQLEAVEEARRNETSVHQEEVEQLKNLSKELDCELRTTRSQELQALALLEALRTGVQSLSAEQALGEQEVALAVQTAISQHESLVSECKDLRKQAASGPAAAEGHQVALERSQKLAETRLHEIQSLSEQASQWRQMETTQLEGVEDALKEASANQEEMEKLKAQSTKLGHELQEVQTEADLARTACLEEVGRWQLEMAEEEQAQLMRSGELSEETLHIAEELERWHHESQLYRESYEDGVRQCAALEQESVQLLRKNTELRDENMLASFQQQNDMMRNRSELLGATVQLREECSRLRGEVEGAALEERMVGRLAEDSLRRSLELQRRCGGLESEAQRSGADHAAAEASRGHALRELQSRCEALSASSAGALKAFQGYEIIQVPMPSAMTTFENPRGPRPGPRQLSPQKLGARSGPSVGGGLSRLEELLLPAKGAAAPPEVHTRRLKEGGCPEDDVSGIYALCHQLGLLEKQALQLIQEGESQRAAHEHLVAVTFSLRQEGVVLQEQVEGARTGEREALATAELEQSAATSWRSECRAARVEENHLLLQSEGSRALRREEQLERAALSAEEAIAQKEVDLSMVEARLAGQTEAAEDLREALDVAESVLLGAVGNTQLGSSRGLARETEHRGGQSRHPLLPVPGHLANLSLPARQPEALPLQPLAWVQHVQQEFFQLKGEAQQSAQREQEAQELARRADSRREQALLQVQELEGSGSAQLDLQEEWKAHMEEAACRGQWWEQECEHLQDQVAQSLQASVEAQHAFLESRQQQMATEAKLEGQRNRAEELRSAVDSTASLLSTTMEWLSTQSRRGAAEPKDGVNAPRQWHHGEQKAGQQGSPSVWRLPQECMVLREEVQVISEARFFSSRTAAEAEEQSSALEERCNEMRGLLSKAVQQEEQARSAEEMESERGVQERQLRSLKLGEELEVQLEWEQEARESAEAESQSCKELRAECGLLAERIAGLQSSEHRALGAAEEGMRLRRALQQECLQLRTELRSAEAAATARQTVATATTTELLECLAGLGSAALDAEEASQERAVESCKAHMRRELLLRNQRLEHLCTDLGGCVDRVALSAALTAKDSQLLLEALSHKDRGTVHEEFNLHVQGELHKGNQDMERACESLRRLAAELAGAMASNAQDADIFQRVADLRPHPQSQRQARQTSDGRTQVLKDLLQTNQQLQHEGLRLKQLAGNVAVVTESYLNDQDTVTGNFSLSSQRSTFRLSAPTPVQDSFEAGRREGGPGGPGTPSSSPGHLPGLAGRAVAVPSRVEEQQRVPRSVPSPRASQAEAEAGHHSSPASAGVGPAARRSSAARDRNPFSTARAATVTPAAAAGHRPGPWALKELAAQEQLHHLEDERTNRSQHLQRACELFREEAGLLMEAENQTCQGSAADSIWRSQGGEIPWLTTVNQRNGMEGTN